MIVQTFVLSPFQQNTRIVVCDKTQRAVCIDPGDNSPELARYLCANGLTLQAITLTHGHLDHVGGTAALASEFPDAEILLHKGDEALYRALPRQALGMGFSPHLLRAFGMEYDEPPAITRYWTDGETYEVGDLRFKVIHCPGHTPGHVVFAEEDERVVFVGDCLFEGSIGRTDFPGGSYEQLIDSIVTKILPLGDDFVVYSGHGPETTIGRERRTNPFLVGSS